MCTFCMTWREKKDEFYVRNQIKRWEKFKDKKKTKQDERYIYSSSFSLLSPSQIHLHKHIHNRWPFKRSSSDEFCKPRSRVKWPNRAKDRDEGINGQIIHVKIRQWTECKKMESRTGWRERKQTKHFVSWLKLRAHISCKLSFSIFTVAQERVRVLLFGLALSST